MPSEEARIAVLESENLTIKESISRFRDHISDLLTFKNTWEGGLKVMLWIMTFVGVTNVSAVIYMAYKMFNR